PPMIASLKIFSPFIDLLNGSGMFILRLFRIPQSAHRHVHSAEEMALLFAESKQGGLIAEDEHERLTQALQLENRRISEIMVPREEIQALDVEMGLDEVLKTLEENPYTRWPVYRESLDDIIGIAHARDIV